MLGRTLGYQKRGGGSEQKEVVDVHRTTVGTEPSMLRSPQGVGLASTSVASCVIAGEAGMNATMLLSLVDSCETEESVVTDTHSGFNEKCLAQLPGEQPWFARHDAGDVDLSLYPCGFAH